MGSLAMATGRASLYLVGSITLRDLATTCAGLCPVEQRCVGSPIARVVAPAQIAITTREGPNVLYGDLVEGLPPAVNTMAIMVASAIIEDWTLGRVGLALKALNIRDLACTTEVAMLLGGLPLRRRTLLAHATDVIKVRRQGAISAVRELPISKAARLSSTRHSADAVWTAAVGRITTTFHLRGVIARKAPATPTRAGRGVLRQGQGRV